jgi:adenylate cyclase
MPVMTEPSGEQIRARLERVLQSQDFAASGSISTFLSYVVEETLAGRAEMIKGYTIAVRAYAQRDRIPGFATS